MKKQITVCVTKSDISAGSRRAPSQCPVALATKRHTKAKVKVGNSEVSFGKQELSLPKKARDFIWDFDVHGKDYYTVKPFKFHLLVNRK